MKEHKIYFTTKPNVLGNSYQSVIDLDSKTIKAGYNLFVGRDAVVVSHKQIKEINKRLISDCGYSLRNTVSLKGE